MAEDPPDSRANLARAHAREGFSGRMALARVRIARVEDRLAAGVKPREVIRELMESDGVSRRTANDYIRTVTERWAREGEAEPRVEKRARLRELIQSTYRTAMEQKGIAVGFDKDGVMQTEKYDKPDLRAAHALLELMCRFEGVLEQPGGGAGGFNESFALILHNHYYGDAGPVGAIDTTSEPVLKKPDGDE
jgi:hypothetical protein